MQIDILCQQDSFLVGSVLLIF